MVRLLSLCDGVCARVCAALLPAFRSDGRNDGVLRHFHDRLPVAPARRDRVRPFRIADCARDRHALREPLISAWLFATYGSTTPIALYIAATGLISLLSAYFLAETFRARLDEDGQD